jgi:hypothetical protein
MNAIRNMTTVAVYEARTLWRSWFFRVFAGVIMLLTAGLNGLMSSVGQFPTWVFRAIPADIPYATTLLINLVQSIIVIIPATDFLKRDRSMDTTDVVYIRSMTNTTYVLGKAFGNLLVFVCLDAVALLCAATFNFFSADASVCLGAYFYYALLICLPTLVFCIGLAFFIMSIIRSQPLTLSAMFGLFGLAFFFLPGRLFDFVGLHSPFMFSGIVGFGPGGDVVLLRAMYLLLGTAMILAAALRLKRLPQSLVITRATLWGAIILGSAAVATGFWYVQGNLREQKARAQTVELHNRQFDAPCVTMLSDDLRIVHNGNSISATARLIVSNATVWSIPEYQFRLNPGLAIRDLRSSRKVSFRRVHDYVFVKPADPLQPKSLDTLAFTYDGTINESACYLDIPDEEADMAGAVFFLRKQPRYAFVNKRFVLLTPETLFYPQAGAGYCSDHPEVNAAEGTRFSVSVTADPSLTVVCQGRSDRGPGGVWTFSPEPPLHGVSVIIGDYAARSLTVDSVEYRLLTYGKNDRFSGFFKDLRPDTVASLVRGLKADFENRLKSGYPFRRFTVVEVPLQFTDYTRVWTTGHEALQPEIVLFPENGFSLPDADFKAIGMDNNFNRRGRDQEVVTPQEQQGMLFQRFASSVFLRDNAGRRTMLRPVDRTGPAALLLQWLPPVSAASADLFVFPDYFPNAVTFHAALCQVFSLSIESYYKKQATGDAMGMARNFSGGATIDERVNEALQDSGFDRICKDPRNRALVPDVARALGEYLFTVLRKNIGDAAFDEVMRATIVRDRFKVLDLKDFCDTVRERSGFDFLPVLQACYRKHSLPGYVIDNIAAAEVRDKTADRFQVRFEIANPESAAGLVKVSVRTGTQGGGRPGGGFPGGNRGGFAGNGTTVDRVIALGPRQCKEIDILTDQPPRLLSVNTLLSKNIPSTIVHPFDKVAFDADRAPFDGEKDIDAISAPEPGTVIVDDEDAGFSIVKTPTAGLSGWFKGFADKARGPQDRFAAMRIFDPPAEWTEAAGPQFYGKYVHAVHYIKSGNGAKRIVWSTPIKESGTYEIYAYYGVMGFQRGNGRRQGRAPVSGAYHYIVHHDDGLENEALALKDLQNGWNPLGRYHLSQGTATVELTDQEGGQGIVAGDAIKWVKE